MLMVTGQHGIHGVGAENPRVGAQLLSEGRRPPEYAVPIGAQGTPYNECWPVWSHHDPLVSVIIPVGPNHTHYLVDALDSVLAQTFPFWEAVVVNDSGEELNTDFAPWARVVDFNGRSIAGARNAGITAARAPLVLFLDVDDLLTPPAIERMLRAFVETDGTRYIYTDWWQILPGEPPKKKSAKPYDRTRSSGSTHPISVLLRS